MTTSFRKILFIKWHKTHRLTSIKIRYSDIYTHLQEKILQ